MEQDEMEKGKVNLFANVYFPAEFISHPMRECENDLCISFVIK